MSAVVDASQSHETKSCYRSSRVGAALDSHEMPSASAAAAGAYCCPQKGQGVEGLASPRLSFRSTRADRKTAQEKLPGLRLRLCRQENMSQVF